MSMATRNLLVLMFLFISAFAAWNTSAEEKSIGASVKEVFLKGSMDGKHLFMVYGIENAGDDIKKLASKSKLDLSDFVATRAMINNPNHADDYMASLRDGAGMAKEFWKDLPEHFVETFTAPWESLSKIPGSYIVNFSKAREAYRMADDRLEGGLNYAAYAVWAQFQGAYYLVLEAPVAMAGEAAITTFLAAGGLLSVPLTLTFHTADVAFHAVSTLAVEGLRLTLSATAAIAMETYALTSSSIAAMLVLAREGFVRPFRAPVLVERATQIPASDLHSRLGEALIRLDASNIDARIAITKTPSKIERAKNKVVLVFNHEKSKAITVELKKSKKGVILAKAKITHKFLNDVKKDFASTEQAKENIKTALDELLDILL